MDPKKEAKRQGEERANEKIEQGVDEGFDKIEEGLGGIFKKKEKKGEDVEADEADEEDLEEADFEEVELEEEDVDEKVSTVKADVPQQKLEAFTQYDFVPGDKILFFEDFSQDAIGDFPALWATNGSGEIKTVSIAPGKWFHMNGDDAVYCYSKSIDFPVNFIAEFDIIPDENYNGFTLTFYEESDVNELNDDLYPGDKGLHISFSNDSWQTKGYNNIDGSDWLEGNSETKPVTIEEVNHVIIWIQNRRVRIYHQGGKTLDMPTNIFAGSKFSRLRFSGWDTSSKPFITNVKVTTAAPDTRSKLLTEGKLISYGIYFDSGKDVVKPESYGSVKEIASVLKENPDVRIKIVGHTDSDGDNASNLDLSKRRAASVKNYLVSQFQIDAGRIETDGKGEGEPIENNSTPGGKAKNRRVEFLKI